MNFSQRTLFLIHYLCLVIASGGDLQVLVQGPEVPRECGQTDALQLCPGAEEQGQYQSR